MFRKILTGIGVTAITAAALMLGAGSALAQHGGGHGGGGHGGGGHGGGGHASVSHGSGGHGGSAWHGGSGTWHGGDFNRGRHFDDHGRGFGWWGWPGFGWGWGYPYYGGGLYSGYYPYYGDYYPYYSDYYPYADTLQPNYDYGYMPYTSTPMTAVPSNSAEIVVRVPDADAQVRFQGQLTSQSGMVRQFESPPLKPGKNYSYDIRAQWDENGRTVTQTRHVDVRAGSVANVDFNQPQPPPVPTSTGR